MESVAHNYSRILFPVDFSECSMGAWTHAEQLARRYSAVIHVLYVVEPIDVFASADGVEQSVYYDVMQRVREQAQSRIQSFGSEATARGLSVEISVREGRPSDVIVHYAQEREISLICLSTHGRTGLPHMFLGSTTEHVVRKAPCPVFVVRCEPPQKA